MSKSKKKITVEVDDDIKLSATQRSCCSIVLLIKSIFNFIVCISIMLIIGAFTRSSMLSVGVAFIYANYYPKFIYNISMALFKTGTIRNELFSQNHIWNICACVFFFTLYIIGTGIMQVFIDRKLSGTLTN